MTPFLFNRKKGEAVIDSEAKQKTHSFFACLMGCITESLRLYQYDKNLDLNQIAFTSYF